MEHVIKSLFFFFFFHSLKYCLFFFFKRSISSSPSHAGKRDETQGQWCSGRPVHQGSRMKSVIGKNLMLLINKKKKKCEIRLAEKCVTLIIPHLKSQHYIVLIQVTILKNKNNGCHFFLSESLK